MVGMPDSEMFTGSKRLYFGSGCKPGEPRLRPTPCRKPFRCHKPALGPHQGAAASSVQFSKGHRPEESTCSFFSDVFRFPECQATEFEPPEEPRSLTFANHVGELLQSRPHVGDMDKRKVSRDSCATSSSKDKFRKVLFPRRGSVHAR